MKKKTGFYVNFSAETLWILEPLVRHQRMSDTTMRFIDGSVFVEPAEQGGAYVGAVSQHALLVVHEPDARCTGPAVLDIPDSIFNAVAPAEPLLMDYCGTTYEADMPEWMQPGDVHATEAGIFVHPRMRHPQWAEEDVEFWPALAQVTASIGAHSVGDDYHGKADVIPANWRKPLQAAGTASVADGATSIAVNPVIIDLYTRAYEASYDRALRAEVEAPAFHMRFTGRQGAILIAIDGRPDITGVLMPQKGEDAPTIPWHFIKRSRADG